jgi:AcrR family transcriptional regulator
MLGKIASMNSEPTEKGTRERILEVSARLFAEYGYSGTSIRDIASELGISNPSLYYHFHSKGEILAELLAEPLERVEIAVSEAKQATGDERTRIIINGLLDALEVHSGIAITGFREINQIPKPYRELAATMQPRIMEMLGEGISEETRRLRVTMAISAVEGAMSELMLNSIDSNSFIEKLRTNRSMIIELVLRILR